MSADIAFERYKEIRKNLHEKAKSPNKMNDEEFMIWMMSNLINMYLVNNQKYIELIQKYIDKKFDLVYNKLEEIKKEKL